MKPVAPVSIIAVLKGIGVVKSELEDGVPITEP